MVRSTGTFVNNDSTSREAMFPSTLFALRISKKSVPEFKLYVAGMYGDKISQSFLATSYVGAGTYDRHRRSKRNKS